MVLAGLGLNRAAVSLFRMRAPQSPLTRNWLPLEAWILAFFGPWSWWLHHLLFVVALHHLSVSLGRQNATLGSFTGDGFVRFGLESCWGFSVSDACSTEPFDEELASAWILAFFGPWSWWLHHLLFVGALHHLSVSLGRQNATLGSFTGDGFGRFGLESCWGFPVSHACPTEPFDEELASAWGLNPRVLRALILESWWLHHLLFVVALHHLSVSLGRQNATLGSFTADGFGKFGLESCWGFPVSDACPTEPFDEELASAWGLNPRVLRALILVVASSFVCGCIASSFCFSRPSERNVRHFYGGWFWQVWAWVLLGFPCFACMPHRALWRGIGFRLRLESSRSSGLDLGILVVASSSVCGCIASSFCFFRPSERNVRHFHGGWFWQVWCMPHRALWRGIGFRLRLESSRSSGLDLGILVVASSFVCGCIASSFCQTNKKTETCMDDSLTSSTNLPGSAAWAVALQ